MIDLSIVVVNWNTRVLIEECLDSLCDALARWRRNTSEPREASHEICVVDNGSTDGSVEWLRDCRHEIDLVELPENRGFAVAANVGLQRAAGRFVLLLNTDARLLDGAIEHCLRAFEADPCAGIAGVQLLHPDGRLQNSIHAFPSLVLEILPSWLLELGLPHRFPSKRRKIDGPTPVDAVLGAVLFVRREALECVGPLCEDYFFFLEETDWCWQMRQAGWRVLHVPEARAVHRSGASSKSRDAAATRIEYQRSLDLFLRRRRGRLSAGCVACVRFARSLLSLLWLAPASLFSARDRSRLRERTRLLRWYVRGRPKGWGLATR